MIAVFRPLRPSVRGSILLRGEEEACRAGSRPNTRSIVPERYLAKLPPYSMIAARSSRDSSACMLPGMMPRSWQISTSTAPSGAAGQCGNS
jgi:hypothetical protein